MRNVVLANGNVHLEFFAANGKFTGFSIASRGSNGWVPIGTSRPFGLAIYQSANGEDKSLPLLPTDWQEIRNGLSFKGQAVDVDGVTWYFEYEFTTEHDSCQVAVSYKAQADRDRSLLAWRGPFLHAGEGGFNTRKTDALFPGLEWLLGAEASSSTDNVAEQYADRHVPHPYKITIPMMAVSADGYALGLFWDPLQIWADAQTYPAAVFDSPNRIEGQNNHLMGLCVPSVGRWLRENHVIAANPFLLRAGTELCLIATIVACRGDSLAVLEEWLRSRGLPELPPRPLPDRETLALCVKCYTDVVWEPSARGWHHTLRDPWGPRYEPHPALQSWRYAQLTSDPDQRERLRAMVRSAVEQSLAQGKSAPHLELAFHYGRLSEVFTTLHKQVTALIAQQQPDGSWPFEPNDQRQRLLGRVGDSSSGLTAQGAMQVLKYARLTGDPVAVQSGRRALEYLRGQQRPEGAQTWELQVHVPDILAAAWAVDACLEGYRLSGEDRDLTEARRWAFSGLPFIYLWSPLFRPIMRYGSVPAFGATFYDRQPWFGVVVQWNGLDYARALIDLASYDESFPWRTIAEGIVACAIQQQAPPDHPFAGMYPDAYSVVKGDEEYTWWLHPGLIGNCLFPLAGISLEPQTILVPTESGRIHLTAAGTLDAIQVGVSQMTFRHQYPSSESSYLLLAGCQVIRVEQDRQCLPEVENLAIVPAGWQELTAVRAYAIKVASGSTQSEFRVEWRLPFT